MRIISLYILVASLLITRAADLNACYGALDPSLVPGGVQDAPVTCRDPSTPQDDVACLLLCGVCTLPELRMGLSNWPTLCDGSVVPSASIVSSKVASSLLNISELQGHFFFNIGGGGSLSSNATSALAHILRYMPLRDAMVLLREPFSTLEYLLDNVRLALATRPWSEKMGVPWSVFLDDVLPYAIVGEVRVCVLLLSVSV
jgi:hypothetical protein